MRQYQPDTDWSSQLRACSLRTWWSQRIGALYAYAATGIVTLSGLAAGSVAGETGCMKPPADAHYRHRFPAEIISHAVWLYHVFSLSLPDIELLLAEREALSLPMRPSGDGAGNSTGHSQTAAPPPARRQMVPRREVHPDPGVQHYLWRVVDQDGVVLDVLVPPRRDAKAAKGFFRRLLKAFPTHDRDRQAAKLRRGSAPTPAQR